MRRTRREWLRALGVAAACGLAGCATGAGEPSETTGRQSTTAAPAGTETTASTASTTEPAGDDGADGPGDEKAAARAELLGEPDEAWEEGWVYRDVPFRDTEHGTLALDYYHPRAAAGSVPVVVHVHGGAWAFGSKGAGRFAHVPLDEGAAVASVQYRLSGTTSYPHPVRDVVGGVAWCREHADDLGVDTGRVGITGESAGGHLSSLVAAAPDAAVLRPDGVSAAAARVACVVSVSGVYDFTVDEFEGADLVRAFLGCERGECSPERADASPVTHLDTDDPPALLYHGTADTVVPHSQAERYVDAAEDAGQPVELVTGDGGEHVDPYAGDWGDRYETTQRSFLQEHLF